jgi:hypothetical protein
MPRDVAAAATIAAISVMIPGTLSLLMMVYELLVLAAVQQILIMTIATMGLFIIY